jgi:hypothetical protein
MFNRSESGPIDRKETGFDSLKSRIKRGVARAAIVGVCVIPPADMAISDALGAKIYTGVNNGINSLEIESDATKHAAEVAANSAIIMAEVMSIGMLIARNSRFKKTFEKFDDYVDDKHSMLAKAIDLPFIGLKALGDATEKRYSRKLDVLTEEMKTNENVSLLKQANYAVDKTAMDGGMLLATGTNGVIMQETIAGNPPSNKRIAWLGALMTTEWMGGAELIRSVYEHSNGARKILHPIGEAFTTATSFESPVGAAIMGSIAAGLAISGYGLAKYTQEKEMVQDTFDTDSGYGGAPMLLATEDDI